MRVPRLALVSLMLASAALAQSDGTGPILLVHVKWAGETIQIERVEPSTGYPPFFLGFAQSRPLWLEVTDKDGNVTYADEVRDPRVLHGGSDPADPKSAEGKPALLDPATAVIPVPAQDAAEVRVYRRVDQGKTYRQEVARAPAR